MLIGPGQVRRPAHLTWTNMHIKAFGTRYATAEIGLWAKVAGACNLPSVLS
ncbi:hypothetical protein FRUB_09874 [Fimbriiglobus ruber]|uniref:Uncharacterized protein n=1 Tax=Fimbriiglobus ruber TaxID=1908690 RepID=A0A225D0J9_9BACT|nr:hypothetical protein FRUB_09874 [Fimbriiglobus ruber]